MRCPNRLGELSCTSTHEGGICHFLNADGQECVALGDGVYVFRVGPRSYFAQRGLTGEKFPAHNRRWAFAKLFRAEMDAAPRRPEQG